MITPILLCGGSGTRLWPLSRKSYPKQFADILGEESLFQASARRFTAGAPRRSGGVNRECRPEAVQATGRKVQARATAIRRFGQPAALRSRGSVRRARGSAPLSSAVTTRVAGVAQVRPPPSDPANRAFLRGKTSAQSLRTASASVRVSMVGFVTRGATTCAVSITWLDLPRRAPDGPRPPAAGRPVSDEGPRGW